MVYKILILGASYGSLLGTKFAAAGHNVTLVCRKETADLINQKGTEVRIKLRDEETHRSFFSKHLEGQTNAVPPELASPENYDLACLAMQEPQYSNASIKTLLNKITKAKLACMSIMNMPPPPFLKRIVSLDNTNTTDAFLDSTIWNAFKPDLMTLCSPDPQAFRPPEELPNVLHVGLPTNFKVSKFSNQKLDKMLSDLSTDIEEFRVDGKDVPVKLRVFESLFVPLAKWAMLATGNYRSITHKGFQSIRDSVHTDLNKSQKIYEFVNQMVINLGADSKDLVPFEKYAAASKGLLKPSSAARAVSLGAINIERVDKLIKLSAEGLGLHNEEIKEIVQTVDKKLDDNYWRSKGPLIN